MTRPRTRPAGSTCEQGRAEDFRTEKALLAHVRKAARFYGWRLYHTRYSLGSDAGFPDCFLVRGSRAVAAELKGPTGKLTNAQFDWLEALDRAGIETHVWQPDSLDEIHEILGPEV